MQAQTKVRPSWKKERRNRPTKKQTLGLTIAGI